MKNKDIPSRVMLEGLGIFHSMFKIYIYIYNIRYLTFFFFFLIFILIWKKNANKKTFNIISYNLNITQYIKILILEFVSI